ncbi:MAG: molybdopterin-synthase adenylyltransferase MoeB [Gammaproteobacteria bacterium]|nr:molybdopterin-synthase adenylyltransferase MoeB [Gammaproteobacteria bacterium]
MDDQQLLRYSRHILLPQIDALGQQRLLNSSALIVGLGGLGSPLAMYLASSGVGHLILADGDNVDITNLQRQIIHGSADIGKPKAHSAQQRLQLINPEIRITPVAQRLDDNALRHYVSHVDIVIDGSDNFTTRFAVNRACVAAKKPLVSGAAIRFEGQLSVFDPRIEGSPCYHCLYREGSGEEMRCSENGILAPLVGLIGSLQAIEAIKVLLGIGEPLVGKLLLVDALSMELRTIKLRQDPQCGVCNH